MAESASFDLIVIGAGPGGYVAAIRASQLGMRVACIETRKTLGGTCLNVGCIPSKALLESSELFHSAQHSHAEHGVKVAKVELDLKSMLARKDKVVGHTTGGVEFLFKKNKITRFEGRGRIVKAGEVAVEGEKPQTLHGKTILIATGSEPIPLPFAPFDGQQIVSSTEALTLPSVPKHLIVIGAGVIGLELGSVWMRLGAKVTVLEMLPSLFPTLDGEVAKMALRTFTKQGFTFHFKTKVTGVKAAKKGVTVTVEDESGTSAEHKGDAVLVAIGRRPCTEGLGAQEAGVTFTDRGRIQVDAHFQTNVPGIYAIGDVIDGPMLAHKASEEGIAFAELLAGQAGHVNYEAIPWIVYTWPEIAWIGPGEEELKKQGREYRVGKFPFSANARARTMGETDGQVKIIADAKTDRLLSVSIIGPRASDMIAEAAIAFEFGGSAEDLARSVHAHPTLAEAIKEAALGVDGRMLHM